MDKSSTTLAGGFISPNQETLLSTLAMNFVATGLIRMLVLARETTSLVCASDAAFGGDGVVGVIGGDSR